MANCQLGAEISYNYRLPVGRPKLPRRTRVGGRQGARTPGGDAPPAEALPRSQGRVVRCPRRSKRRAVRPPNRGRPRPGGPPDSAPTSRRTLGRTPSSLALMRGSNPRATPTRLGRGRRRRHPRSIGVGGVTQALTEANAPTYESFVTVNKLPSRLVVFPANLAGQVEPGSRPVQRLVYVQQLAELRVRVRVRPLRHVGEVQLHEAVHQAGGQMPQVPLGTGGRIPHPRHIQHPLGREDGRRRGGLPPMKRCSKVGHDAGHPCGEPKGYLHGRPPRRRLDIVGLPLRSMDLGALHLRSTHQDPRRLSHPALGAGVLVVEVGIPFSKVRGRAASLPSRHDGRDFVHGGPDHHVRQARGHALHPRRVPSL